MSSAVAGSFFGRGGDGTRAACVNPAALGGGSATLQPIFYLTPPEGTLLGGISVVQPFTDPALTAEVTTPWVEYPDFVEAAVRSGRAADALRGRQPWTVAAQPNPARELQHLSA